MNVSGASLRCRSSGLGPGRFCRNSDLQRLPASKLTGFSEKPCLCSGTSCPMVGECDES